jgi:hypothetical protein
MLPPGKHFGEKSAAHSDFNGRRNVATKISDKLKTKKIARGRAEAGRAQAQAGAGQRMRRRPGGERPGIH